MTEEENERNAKIVERLRSEIKWLQGRVENYQNQSVYHIENYVKDELADHEAVFTTFDYLVKARWLLESLENILKGEE